MISSTKPPIWDTKYSKLLNSNWANQMNLISTRLLECCTKLESPFLRWPTNSAPRKRKDWEPVLNRPNLSRTASAVIIDFDMMKKFCLKIFFFSLKLKLSYYSSIDLQSRIAQSKSFLPERQTEHQNVVSQIETKKEEM